MKIQGHTHIWAFGRIFLLISLAILMATCSDQSEPGRNSQQQGSLIEDGPWDSQPEGASPVLAIDREWGALTIQTDMERLAFILEPDQGKDAYANSIHELKVYEGRLYLGYGDIINNQGPVDIVSYDPLTGTLTREMLDIPEEAVGGWYSAEDGYFYAAGLDAQESWDFGNIFVKDGTGWQKRRTLPQAVHVLGVVDFKGRLYASASFAKPQVKYPFVLVSDDHGAHWSHEQVDEPMSLEALQHASSICYKVSQATGEFLYVKSWSCFREDYQECQNHSGIRHYRFDGKSWLPLNISDPDVKAIFERCEAMGSPRCVEREGWFYCLRDTPGESPIAADSLCRTKDFQKWEKVTDITLPPGVQPLSIGFLHNRLYVGAGSSGRWIEKDYIALHPQPVFPIKDAVLQWNAEVPEGAGLSLKIRTASRNPGILDKPWVGPDGTEKTSFTVSGKSLHPSHNGDCFIQVAISKTANAQGESPQLRNLTIENPGGIVTLAVDEGQGLYTASTRMAAAGAEYLSPVFRLQRSLSGCGLFYEGATPGRTSLKFQVRSAQSEDEIVGNPFVGPDGGPSTFYTVSGQALSKGHRKDRYVQYRAVLNSPDPTLAPFLHKVKLAPRSRKR